MGKYEKGDKFALFPVLTHDEKGAKTFGYQIGLLDCVDCVDAVTFSSNLYIYIYYNISRLGGNTGQCEESG